MRLQRGFTAVTAHAKATTKAAAAAAAAPAPAPAPAAVAATIISRDQEMNKTFLH
uniref:Uncharacterized protein n=1 Tax=Glossina palpalis gambiensis TaxID=67801 RepID=A0A1B0B640_9MUSC